MATTNKEFRTKNGIVSGDTISATGLAGALLSSTNPVALGSAGPGTSTIPSRQDHVHPTTGLMTNPMTTLGDVLYGGASGTPTRLAGDTSNSNRFLRSVSAGGVAAAPTWAALTGADIASGTIPSAVLGNSSVFIGTTSIALNRGTGALTLAGITLTDGVLTNIVASTGTAADLWSEVTTGSITIGTGLTSGALNLATGGTSATPIGIGHTNATLTMTGASLTTTIPLISLAGVADTATAATHYFVETATDGYIRPKTLANVKTEIVTTAAVNAAAATTVGTVTSGTWNGGVVAGQYGGTGVANTGKTLTISGNTSIGSSTHTVTLATSGNTSVTLPASGTLEVTGHTHSYQPLDTDLTNIAALTGTSGFLKTNGANTWSVDTTVYGTDSLVVHLAGTETITGDKTFNSNTSITSGKYTKYGHANQTDGNDGIFGAGIFSSGLNIVGTQTVSGEGRTIRIWGRIIDDQGNGYPQQGYNFLHNASFTIWQRGTSSLGATNTMTADRWRSTSNSTVTRASSQTGSQSRYAISTTGATTPVTNSLVQTLESEDAYRLRGQKCVLSAMIAAGSSSNVIMRVRYSTTDDTAYGSITTDAITATVAATTTPTYFQVVGTIPSTAKTLKVEFVSATDVSMTIADPKLEIGQTRTLGVSLSEREELARCQRFYQRWTQPPLRGIWTTSSIAARCAAPFPVTMRIAPTPTYSGTIYLYDGSVTPSISSVATNYCTAQTMEFDLNTSGGATAYRPACLYQAGTGYFEFTAEI